MLLNIVKNKNNQNSKLYIKAIILLNLYKHFLSFLFALKAGILKIPGNKFNPNGYNIDNPMDQLNYFPLNFQELFVYFVLY